MGKSYGASKTRTKVTPCRLAAPSRLDSPCSRRVRAVFAPCSPLPASGSPLLVPPLSLARPIPSPLHPALARSGPLRPALAPSSPLQPHDRSLRSRHIEPCSPFPLLAPALPFLILLHSQTYCLGNTPESPGQYAHTSSSDCMPGLHSHSTPRRPSLTPRPACLACPARPRQAPGRPRKALAGPLTTPCMSRTGEQQAHWHGQKCAVGVLGVSSTSGQHASTPVRRHTSTPADQHTG
jgi:hypothetical protein